MNRHPLTRTPVIVSTVVAVVTVAVFLGFGCSTSPSGPDLSNLGDHILVGWNDLGMHCANRNFADLAVLPPYNNIWAVLIQRGEDPQVVHTGYTVTYTLLNNTYSVGKTDFWSHVSALFGVNPANDIGLTGNGLSGDMTWVSDHFEVTGVPVTPYDDSNVTTEQPYQLARLDAYFGGEIIATTEIVVPISNEMNCSNCHVPQGRETVDQAILRLHDEEHDTDLMGSRPVLCAECHSSNALGMDGNPELPSLSLALHGKHAEETNDCYQCHPGPDTECLRGVMSDEYAMVCQDCHGGVSQVANSVAQGREPWLEEPRCGTCHGDAHEEDSGTLYRNSNGNKGHHGLYCAVCHGSPHAILPSREERDNRQNIALQGSAGTLETCAVCHKGTPDDEGPHEGD